MGNTLYMTVDVGGHSNLFSYDGSAFKEVVSPLANSGGLAPYDITAAPVSIVGVSTHVEGLVM